MADADLLAAAKNLVIAVNAMTQQLAKTLPAAQSTATTATSGAATLPGNPLGFIVTTLPNGTSVKLPYYNI